MKALAIVLMTLFAIGWIGCALTIPMAAFKFFSILWEKDSGDEEPPLPNFERIDRH